MATGNWIAATAALALACVAVPVAARSVVAIRTVFYAPPPLVVIAQPVRVERQWVPGRWEWQGNGHMWVPGHWQLPPRAYTYND
jgi:hypothetical protein